MAEKGVGPSASTEPKAEVGRINDFEDVDKFFIRPLTQVNPKWLSYRSAGNIDHKKLLNEHQARLQASTRANQEAAAPIQRHVRCQAETFETIMKSARDSAAKVQVSGTPEAAEANAKLFPEAIQSAKQLMQRRSEETAAASEETYRKILSEVETAINEQPAKIDLQARGAACLHSFQKHSNDRTVG